MSPPELLELSPLMYSLAALFASEDWSSIRLRFAEKLQRKKGRTLPALDRSFIFLDFSSVLAIPLAVIPPVSLPPPLVNEPLAANPSYLYFSTGTLLRSLPYSSFRYPPAWPTIRKLVKAPEVCSGGISMNFITKLLIIILCFFLPALVAAQRSSAPAQAPQRDPQAIAILQQAVAAMASMVPTDSSASGTVTVVEGSTTQTGTIQILTLGMTQTSVTLDLPAGQRTVIYSDGTSKEIFGTQSSNPPLQSVLSDQSVDFPLPFLTGALSNPDESFRYIGLESVNGQSAQHIQLWNSFASKPHLESLASFSLKDVWLDATSGLPLKIAYLRRTSGGLAPGIPVEIFLSKYTKVSGVLYPFQIDKSKNGTPWQTIVIENASVNTGLTAAQFQVQ